MPHSTIGKSLPSCNSHDATQPQGFNLQGKRISKILFTSRHSTLFGILKMWTVARRRCSFPLYRFCLVVLKTMNTRKRKKRGKVASLLVCVNHLAKLPSALQDAKQMSSCVECGPRLSLLSPQGSFHLQSSCCKHHTSWAIVPRNV